MPYQKLIIKKGLKLRIPGRPASDIRTLPQPDQVAVLPARIPHIKPRLHVTEGDGVRIGSVLFEDKRNPRIRFLSPGSGRIQRIEVGPRRAVQTIVVQCRSADEESLSFPVIPYETLGTMTREALVNLILDGGLWWVFRELPFRDMPDPQQKPPLIMVALGAKEPFQPSAEVYLKDQEQLLTYGLAVLGKLAHGRVAVVADHDAPFIATHLNERRDQHQEFDQKINQKIKLIHGVQGRYPADDPGVVLYRTKQSAAQNRAWFITGQDLLLLAALLKRGRYPTERVFAVGGSAATAPRHYRTRLGVPLAHLVREQELDHETRYVVGGLLRGFAGSADGFIGLYETALNLVSEGGQAEFLALFRPGQRKPTYSRTFLSRLNPGSWEYNCNCGGEERACIACMHCADVCPVDILPQMTYKAILAEEVEEYLQHGLLDCVACGLCTYVCPSKIELTQTFVAAKAAYAKERLA